MFVIAVAVCLYKKAFSKALLAGAFFCSLAYAATQTDPEIPRPLLASVVASYLVFHTGYYWSVTRIHRLGDTFTAITLLLTGGLFFLASRVSGSASFWTGLAGSSYGWSVLPIHLVVVACIIWFIRISNDPACESTDIPLLPITNDDIQEGTAQRALHRRRVGNVEC